MNTTLEIISATIIPTFSSQLLPLNMSFSLPSIDPLSKWTGSDVATSIVLDDQTSVWIWGDTITGKFYFNLNNLTFVRAFKYSQRFSVKIIAGYLNKNGSKRTFEGKWPRNGVSIVKNNKVVSVHASIDSQCPQKKETCAFADSLFKPKERYDRFQNFFWLYDGIYLDSTLYLIGNR
jgi:hypothetical protein